jgi:type IV pilus assembly protein PilP
MLVALAGAGSGCDDKPKGAPPGGPRPAAAAAAAAALPAAESTPEVAEVETFIYTSVGKRDPFKSTYREKKAQPTGTDGLSPATVLQQFEIDQLKLIAVVSGMAQPRAMVTTPDGKGHLVKIGTLIGKNFGRVDRIKTSEIIIAEDYRDPIGRKVTNYITMALEREKKR